LDVSLINLNKGQLLKEAKAKQPSALSFPVIAFCILPIIAPMDTITDIFNYDPANSLLNGPILAHKSSILERRLSNAVFTSAQILAFDVEHRERR